MPALADPPGARATNAADAAVEEEALRAWGREVVSIVGALWTCINEHDEKAKGNG